MKGGSRGDHFGPQDFRTEEAPKRRSSYPVCLKSHLRFTSIFVAYLARGIGLFTHGVFAHSLLEVALWVRHRAPPCLEPEFFQVSNGWTEIDDQLPDIYTAVECMLTQKKLMFIRIEAGHTE